MTTLIFFFKLSKQLIVLLKEKSYWIDIGEHSGVSRLMKKEGISELHSLWCIHQINANVGTCVD